MRPRTCLWLVGALCALTLGAAPAGAAAKDTPSPGASRARPLLVLSVHPNGTLQQKEAAFRQLPPMGFDAIRTDFSWSGIDPRGVPVTDPAHFAWSGTDDNVSAARHEGLGVIALLAYGHHDYSPGGNTSAPPTDLTAFGTFAANVANRYRGQIYGYEIWNEENLGFRFWQPQADPVTYGKLLCEAHNAIRKVDTDTPVSSGGVFFPSLPIGPLMIGGVSFLDQMLTDGGTADDSCFDAVAFHPYPYPFTSPEAVVAGRGSVIDASEQVRAVLDQHGVSKSVPLWNTESGWPTNPPVEGATPSLLHYNGVTTTKQAQYLVRTYLLSWQQGLPVVTLYDQFDTAESPSDPGNQEDHFGLYHDDGTPKPAVPALQHLNEELGGAGWRYVSDKSRALKLPSGTNGVNKGYALKFKGPHDQRALVLWYANEQPPGSLDETWMDPVTPGTAPATIKVRVGLHQGEVVRDMHGDRIPASAELDVGQSPIYISWKAH